MDVTRRDGIVAACDDPSLFGIDLWPRQRELLSIVERGPRIQVWALGRRSSKTTMAAIVGLHDCLAMPELETSLRSGEQRHVVAVATNLSQARLFVAAARSIAEGSPVLSKLIQAVTDDQIVFKTGATLAAFPCTGRGIRGFPISTLLLDEAAHHVDTDGNQSAQSIWEAAVPSTIQFGAGARVIVSSTPLGAEGFFADLWRSADAGELDGAVAVHGASWEFNPTLDPAMLHQERKRNPESFRAEYGAEFVGSGGAYIEAAAIRAATREYGELDRLDARDWVLGIDLGFYRDPAAAVLVGRSPQDDDRLVVGRVWTWNPRKADSFSEARSIQDEVLSEIAEIARYFAAEVVTDQHLAPAVRNYFTQEGIRVRSEQLSAETKSLAFAELRHRIHSGILEIYDDPRLVSDLRRLRTQRLAGKANVATPRSSGGHCDVAVALALGVWRSAQRGSTNLHAAFYPLGPSLCETFGLPYDRPAITADFRF